MSIIKGPSKSTANPNATLTTIQIQIPAGSMTNNISIYVNIKLDTVAPPPDYEYLITVPGNPQINGNDAIPAGLVLGKGSDLVGKTVNIRYIITKGVVNNNVNVKYDFKDGGTFNTTPDNVQGLNSDKGVEVIDTNINFIA